MSDASYPLILGLIKKIAKDYPGHMMHWADGTYELFSNPFVPLSAEEVEFLRDLGVQVKAGN